jgi:crotonobetainyl-CoA:carnitine CoA-transferase CaiB-like acyl-CoA transferase
MDNFLDRELLPKIPKDKVHCSIRGFDSDTPLADTPGYDLLAQAESGLMWITGDPDGEPMKAGVALADVLTAHYAYGAITSALVERAKTGRGASLEVSLFSATLASLVNVAQNAIVTRREATRYGNAHPSIVPYQVFHGSDRAFAVGAGTDRHFRLLCNEVLGRGDLAADRRFTTNPGRVRHRVELISVLEGIFLERKAAQWVARCRKFGVPAALVRGVREALKSPGARGLVSGDTIQSPIIVDGMRRGLGAAPPRLGQHTDRVLEELGYSAREIASLRADGTI